MSAQDDKTASPSDRGLDALDHRALSETLASNLPPGATSMGTLRILDYSEVSSDGDLSIGDEPKSESSGAHLKSFSLSDSSSIFGSSSHDDHAPILSDPDLGSSNLSSPRSNDVSVSSFDETEMGSNLSLSDELSELNVLSAEVEIGPELARGGVGVIRAGVHRALNREVVIKSLRRDRRSSRQAREMIHEARLTSRLEHPNIIPIHTLCWDEEEGPTIVMKRVEGVSWSELIDDDEHPAWAQIASPESDRVARHLKILEGVCRAVEFAHSRGVIHRDIKPDNIMVGVFGEIYLLDWGVARDLKEDEPSTRLVGTPAYMAPEMAHPQLTADERADIFLLGASLHRALTGKPRYRASSIAQVIQLALDAHPHAYSGDVPQELQEICNRACARALEARYESVAAFREALNQFTHHRESIKLAELGDQHLGVLEELTAQSTQVLLIHRAFSSCRGAYEQALNIWRDNPRALYGLERALIEMARYELNTHNPQSAELLLAELPHPPAELLEQLKAAWCELERRDAAQRQLNRLQREMRVRGTRWGRSLTAILHAFTIGTILFMVSSAISWGWLEASVINQIYLLAVYSVLQVISIRVFKDDLLDSEAFKDLMMTLVMIGPIFIMNRVFALLSESGQKQILAGDLIVLCTCMITLAASRHSFFWGSALIALCTALIALWRFDLAFEVIGVGYLINNLYMAWILRPRDE